MKCEINKRLFCNKKCYLQYYSSHKKGENVACEICGLRFYKFPYRTKRFNVCSNKCLFVGKKKDKKYCTNTGNFKGENINCKVCNKSFFARYCELKNGKKYCSNTCYFEDIRKNPKIHPNYKNGRYIIICQICGKTAHTKNSKFCSKECYAKYKSVVRRGDGNTFFGKHHSNKTKKKISEINHITHSTPEAKIRRSLQNKKYYMLHPEKHPNRTVRNKYTTIEKKIKSFLDTFLKENIDYEYNKCIHVKNGILFPDFIIKEKLIVEADGQYWHKDTEKENLRDSKLIYAGYIILHLKEKEINDNFEEVKEKIKNAIVHI
jgi:very-short-patch-repair endonuclease